VIPINSLADLCAVVCHRIFLCVSLVLFEYVEATWGILQNEMLQNWELERLWLP
jgi:hypothetical protein